MARIRITKSFDFEMAHALWDYDGSCSNIHGHSYKLLVTLIGDIIRESNNPKDGMVIDFGDLKKIVANAIIGDFDHSLVISSKADLNSISSSKQMFNRVRIVDFQPTCENLLVFFVEKIRAVLPADIVLFSLKLIETASSYAEWYADDNR